MASIPPLVSKRCDLKEKKNFLLKVRAQKFKKTKEKKHVVSGGSKEGIRFKCFVPQ